MRMLKAFTYAEGETGYSKGKGTKSKSVFTVLDVSFNGME